MSRFLSPAMEAVTPYQPGSQPQNTQGVVKLNTNESPFPPPTAVMDAIREEEMRLHLYPDPCCRQLRQAAAEAYGLQPEQVLAGNGSDEVLYFALRAFCDSGRPLAFADVTYGFYGCLCSLLGVPAHIIPLRPDLTLDPGDYCGLGQTVVIANPNAPTGIALPPKALARVAASNPDNVVLVDEAYVDFGADSCLPLLERYKNLLVIRTFSKSRQLAGARLGLALGSPELIEDLDRVRTSLNPYNVSRLAQAAGVASLRQHRFFEETRRQIIQCRQWTAEQLARRGFELTDSKANFLFARTDAMPGPELFRRLWQQGVLVRRFDTPSRIGDWLRITVGTLEQMEKVLDAVDTALKGEC